MSLPRGRRASGRSGRVRSRRAALTAVVAVAGLLAAGLSLGSGASAAAPPTVAITSLLSSPGSHAGYITDAAVYASSGSTGTVKVSASAAPGLTVQKVFLQYEPVGSGQWSLLANGVGSAGSYTFAVGFNNFPQAGVYDVRAVATDSAGQPGTSPPVSDIVVVDDQNIDGNGNQTYIGLQRPNAAVSGTIPLTAQVWSNPYALPDSLSFQLSPTGQQNFSTVATATEELNGAGRPVTTANHQQLYTANLDTTTLPNGVYDLTASGEDANGDPFVSQQTDQITIDNATPTVTLSSPAQSLRGVATLQAAASAGPSGVGSVRFQYAPTGSSTWTTIGVASSAPYSEQFSTFGLVNGSYQLRAIATSGAGVTATSSVATVAVDNSGSGFNPSSLTVTPIVAPASSVHLLGEVKDSSDHETWGYGCTTAAPAVVAGSELDYTAPANDAQLVLLRYTDETGWQIADVLRNADGSAFPLDADCGTNQLSVQGQMVGSGEAWLTLSQNGVTSVFHRAAGGRFVLDTAATPTIQSLVGLGGGSLQLKLGEAGDGSVYGTITDTSQAPTTVSGVSEQLQYAELAGNTWSIATAALPPGFNGQSLDLEAVAPTGTGSGWGIFSAQAPKGATTAPLVLGSYGPNGWSFPSETGLDALDLTGNFANTGTSSAPEAVYGQEIAVDADGVWIQANVSNDSSVTTLPTNEVVALFDPSAGHIAVSWCGAVVLAASAGCGFPLDANSPAAVPDAEFDTSSGQVALALGSGDLDVYANGVWTAVPAPGFSGGSAGADAFNAPSSGWLAGADSLGQLSAGTPTSPLASWPTATEKPLVSVALPPGGAGISQSGALAVGLDGTAVHYDSSQGWLSDPVPTKAQSINLLGVAYDGPSSAVAVGGFGTILDWNGSVWSEDAQSDQLTTQQLNAVAFSSDGEGWAVGTYGTILHYDAGAWSAETIDAEDTGADVTSVTVAGSQVYAVAGGNLITRNADGSWSRVPASQLPSGLPAGRLDLVSGLSNGDVVAAGRSVVIERPSPADGSSAFGYSPQPLEGSAVALQAFLDPSSGALRAYVSVAPPLASAHAGSQFPSGDGDLVEQTDGGWRDLSQDQYPGSTAPDDGVPEPNPVLAIAGDGASAWAVGGYAGTLSATGVGNAVPLTQIPHAWWTSSVWRYDANGSATPPQLAQATVSLPAQADTVSFAFFSSALCYEECAAVQNAQPDSNLGGAAQEIASYAAQPGGPAFAMEGGNAVGPRNEDGQEAGNGAVDLSDFTNVTSPLGTLPLYAALGPLDAVSTSTDPDQPWAAAFAEQPAPFGQGALPGGFAAEGGGDPDGPVNRYYAFNASQNGGTVRVIVLDNSNQNGTLDANAPGQSAWLAAQLSSARAAGTPIVVFCSNPLNINLPYAPPDADAVATELADAGVLGVFTTPGGLSETDSTGQIPADAAPGSPTIPEYEGGTLGYQQTSNNGVLWYFASVDTSTDKLSVQAIPVVQSLALDPIGGLTVARSSTLSFAGVGRRPAGTLPPAGQGYANYVAIPSSGCSVCIPAYTFTSSNPGVGTFVKPSSSGSQYPLLTPAGAVIPSSQSGLFCAFNAGTTTVSVTSGLLVASLTVTVEPGTVGSPCGTVAYAPDQTVETLAGKVVVSSASAAAAGTGGPVAPASNPNVVTATPKVIVPPPLVHTPAPIHTPPVAVTQAPNPPFVSVPSPFNAPAAAITPPIPPPITPVPPGGATAPAQSTAKREEKARKEASQSAYTTRPAGAGDDWFFPAVGAMSLLAIALIGGGIGASRRPEPVLLELGDPDFQRRMRRRR